VLSLCRDARDGRFLLQSEKVPYLHPPTGERTQVVNELDDGRSDQGVLVACLAKLQR
jgi:hypothetical protein